MSTALDVLQIVIVLLVIFLLVRTVGAYMKAVFTGERTFLDGAPIGTAHLRRG